MSHVVLKAFDWSPNGFTIETLPVGAERDFGDSAAGLAAEGWVGATKAAVATATEPEPEPPVVDEPATGEPATEPEPEPPPKRRNRN